MLKCTNCDNTSESYSGQFWHCRDYFGVSGTFCGDCYELVAHDAYRNPVNPQAHQEILTKQQKKESS
jgi:hypothetical protein